jgi:hypothetical protein
VRGVGVFGAMIACPALARDLDRAGRRRFGAMMAMRARAS